MNALQTSYESAVAAANEIQPSDSEPNESTAALINQWEDLKNKVEDMSDDLEAGLSRAEDFHDRLNEVTCWLAKKLADLGEAAPVKATPNAVKEQIHEYTVSLVFDCCLFALCLCTLHVHTFTCLYAILHSCLSVYVFVDQSLCCLSGLFSALVSCISPPRGFVMSSSCFCFSLFLGRLKCIGVTYSSLTKTFENL